MLIIELLCKYIIAFPMLLENKNPSAGELVYNRMTTTQ